MRTGMRTRVRTRLRTRMRTRMRIRMRTRMRTRMRLLVLAEEGTRITVNRGVNMAVAMHIHRRVPSHRRGREIRN